MWMMVQESPSLKSKQEQSHHTTPAVRQTQSGGSQAPDYGLWGPTSLPEQGDVASCTAPSSLQSWDVALYTIPKIQHSSVVSSQRSRRSTKMYLKWLVTASNISSPSLYV